MPGVLHIVHRGTLQTSNNITNRITFLTQAFML